MLRTIIEKEILENILTLRFITAFILCLGLVTISAFVLSNDYAQQLEDYHARVKLHAETANPELINVDKRPSGLAAMFSGMAKESVQTVKLMADDKPEIIEGIEDNPMFTFFPTVDFSFIIGIVMSLLAILFAYDAIAGEREAGTLALIASNAVKRNTLLLGKWLGGFVSLIIPCFAALQVGILIISTNPMIMLSLEDWKSLGIIFAITLIYLSAIFSVGILVSCIAKRSSTAGLMLLFLWAIFVFVIPSISPYVAKAIYPIPPDSQIVRQEKLLVSDLDVKRRQRHETAALEVIEKNLSKKEAFQIIGQIESEWREEKKQRLTNMEGNYLRKVQRQEQIAKGISSISPYACFVYLANGLANTGAESHERFLTQTARFDGEYFRAKDKSSEKPRFRYEDAAVAERMNHSLVQLIILLLLNGLFLILGFVVFLRADVTK